MELFENFFANIRANYLIFIVTKKTIRFHFFPLKKETELLTKTQTF